MFVKQKSVQTSAGQTNAIGFLPVVNVASAEVLQGFWADRPSQKSGSSTFHANCFNQHSFKSLVGMELGYLVLVK